MNKKVIIPLLFLFMAVIGAVFLNSFRSNVKEIEGTIVAVKNSSYINNSIASDNYKNKIVDVKYIVDGEEIIKTQKMYGESKIGDKINSYFGFNNRMFSNNIIICLIIWIIVSLTMAFMTFVPKKELFKQEESAA